MANELVTTIAPGMTLYARVFNAAGQVWNGSAFVALNFAASAKIILADAEGSGRYMATCPSAAITAGAVTYEVRIKVGATAAASDPIVDSDEIATNTGISTAVAAGFASVLEAITDLPLPAPLTGANEVDFIVNDGMGNAIANAKIRITTDVMTTVLTSDVDGDANAGLNDGNYRIVVTADGYTFTPETFLINDANTDIMLSMTQTTFPIQPEPGFTIINGITRTGAGAAKPNALIEFQVKDAPNGILSGEIISQQSGSDGSFAIQLIRGGTYACRYERGVPFTFKIPIDATNIPLNDCILGLLKAF